LKNGAVSRSFLKAGGQALQDECNAYIAQHGQVPIAGAVVTKPGAIPCLGIIHTVGAEYKGKQSEDVSYTMKVTIIMYMNLCMCKSIIVQLKFVKPGVHRPKASMRLVS